MKVDHRWLISDSGKSVVIRESDLVDKGLAENIGSTIACGVDSDYTEISNGLRSGGSGSLSEERDTGEHSCASCRWRIKGCGSETVIDLSIQVVQHKY